MFGSQYPILGQQSILCKAAIVQQSGMGPAQERYVDPRHKQSFLFDHVTHVSYIHL
jgi:hypothetical protein